jgi:ubiquinone/menaquinone biosynthesis C-methylase UbiE
VKAQACLASGKAEEAVKILFGLVENEERAEYFAALGEAYIQLGDAMQAIEAFAVAVQIERGNTGYKQKFLDLVYNMEVTKENPGLKTMVLECLIDEKVDVSAAGNLWVGLLTYDLGFNEAYEGKNYNALLDPFFLTGLKRVVVCNIEFENFLTRLRRDLLLKENKELRSLEEALAAYCKATEYIFFITPEEQEKLTSAKGRAIAEAYPREAAKPSKVPSLAPVTDTTSSAVQGQYEEFPYPRWTHFDPEIKDEETEGYLSEKASNILVAGCGTGKEAIEFAHVFPDSKVLAVDLSNASLSYGIMKANEFEIENVEFRQGDILNLGSLDRKFDFIASSGVLHHMKEPLKGWKVLTGLLKDGGTMRIALYSTAARKKLTEAKTIIKQKGYGNSADEIRRFRHDAPNILPQDVHDYLCTFRDYYYMSECRDLLFHVQEHEYDPLQIKAIIDELGLEFVKFYLDELTLKKYAHDFPKDKQASNLENWQKFEQKNPETFKEMYKFWVRKKSHGTP